MSSPKTEDASFKLPTALPAPSPKRVFSRRRLVLLLSIASLTFLVLLSFSSYPSRQRVLRPPVVLPEAQEPSHSPSPPARRPPLPTAPRPRISIIVIWQGGDRPYFSHFIESINANADVLELVWIGVQQEEEEVCFDPLAGPGGIRREARNVKVVCLDKTEYWMMHRDYFCNRWHCEEDEAEKVMNHMLHRHDSDIYSSFFRLWRGYIFKEFIDPGAGWWAWADPDTFMGNFRSQFPWDQTTYDVLIPASPNESLLYMRGHLCFFRTRQKLEIKFNEFPDLDSWRKYVQHYTPSYAAIEEAQFSAFIFRNPEITFLILPNTLVEIPLDLASGNTPKFATLNGTYRLQTLPSHLPAFPDFPLLSLPGVSPSSPPPSTFKPTFSEEGVTFPIDLYSGAYPGELRFPQEFATYYTLEETTGTTPEWRRFVGRGGGQQGGQQGVWERMEPPPQGVDVPMVLDPSQKVMLQEGLYVHYLAEKDDESFRILPSQPLLRHQVLMTVLNYGAEIWDSEAEQVIWRGEPPTEGLTPTTTDGVQPTAREEDVIGRRNARERRARHGRRLTKSSA